VYTDNRISLACCWYYHTRWTYTRCSYHKQCQRCLYGCM